MTTHVTMVFLGEEHRPLVEVDWPMETPRNGEVVSLSTDTVDEYSLPTRFWRVIQVQHELAYSSPVTTARVLLLDNDAEEGEAPPAVGLCKRCRYWLDPAFGTGVCEMTAARRNGRAIETVHLESLARVSPPADHDTHLVTHATFGCVQFKESQTGDDVVPTDQDCGAAITDPGDDGSGWG